jgi:hypothetical protein
MRPPDRKRETNPAANRVGDSLTTTKGCAGPARGRDYTRIACIGKPAYRLLGEVRHGDP